MRFALSAADPIKAEDEYRSGAKLVFNMWLESKRMPSVSIALVVDEISFERSHTAGHDRRSAQASAGRVA
ncbi:hypothetical protein [Trueperella abortisuis]|uniref:hypothetical protein n=1 Tax=Trueperella abortisuis TaxID=445930 RepID=UPI00289309C2|nr:hypothetical protein [Trueperella abortisuis]